MLSVNYLKFNKQLNTWTSGVAFLEEGKIRTRLEKSGPSCGDFVSKASYSSACMRGQI